MHLLPASLFSSITLALASSAAAQVTVKGIPFGVIPQRPTTLAAEPGNPDRLYAPNKLGRVYLLENGVLGGVFLDISSQVDASGENGLLGMALDPDYATNGFFYLSYTAVGGSGFGDSVVSRFTVSSTNPDLADPSSEVILFGPLAQNTVGHKAGDLKFGPDGMLYYSLGDGWVGGMGVDLRAQDPSDPRGSVLRLDVDEPFPHVAAGNPFIGIAGADERIWVQGLRNPWRIELDRQNGDLYIADVGQSTVEEVNWVPSSTNGPPTGQMNFGWPCKEGAGCFSGAPTGCNCADPSFRDPVNSYDHTQGCSITGGVVYRGSEIPALQGYYVYSDFCTGRIWADLIVGGVLQNSIDLTAQLGPLSSVVSIAADAAGELYIAQHFSGEVIKIIPCCGGTTYCMANANSTGDFTKLDWTGSVSVNANSFGLEASDMPAGQFAFFVASLSEGFVPNVGPSQGNLCLSGTIARFNALVGPSDSAGIFARTLDLNAFPMTPPVAVQPGETWYFQCWHRDLNPQATSNFSQGLSVLFCP